MLKTKKTSSKNIKSYNTKKNIHKQPTIIHISGASSSGKTTLANKLKETFGSKITIIDLDVLFKEYVQKNKIENLNINTYEKYLSDYIKHQNSNKILILVGLNINMLNYRKGISNDYYKIIPNPIYKFYINLPIKILLNVKYERFWSYFCINVLQKDKPKIFKDLIKNQTTTINELNDIVKEELDFTRAIKDTKMWNNYFRNADYKFYNRDKIFNELSKIINKM
jgi:adenylate kinase family enzyme